MEPSGEGPVDLIPGKVAMPGGCLQLIKAAFSGGFKDMESGLLRQIQTFNATLFAV